MYRPTQDEHEEPIGIVKEVRKAMAEWRAEAVSGGGGVTRTTMELLQHWHAEERRHRLFFAQIEAAESIIFLNEGRQDYLQGIIVPPDLPSEEAQAAGIEPFQRLCCKLATGAGKTTVMAMIIAWSILNKIANPRDKRYSDAILVVCPNVTIRDRLRELDPNLGEGSIYRTFDLVPPRLMSSLRRGKVFATNWHVFEKQSASSPVHRTGSRVVIRELIRIGTKTANLHGTRYVNIDEYHARVTTGEFRELSRKLDSNGRLLSAVIEHERYEESDQALVKRVVGRTLGTKQNILVINDEAHHAYRVRSEETADDPADEDDTAINFRNEATVWVNGLDALNKVRKINFCVDLSATPCFLMASGRDINKVFPWTVSNFGLEDAIESGLVKIPLLAVDDTTDKKIPGYLNIWDWVLEQIKKAKEEDPSGDVRPGTVLKYAHTPIAMLAGQWNRRFQEWERMKENGDQRPPVFIIVCKNIPLAKHVYEWIANGQSFKDVPSLAMDSLMNRIGTESTIRVDSRVADEGDTGGKANQIQWMRWVLATVGKAQWPRDSEDREIIPVDFENLATKLGRPLSPPPGRAVRCIVSVSMLTEGWDCNTVTHIIGLRPFMSQLLCEQVIGRALRRRNYVPYETPDGNLFMTEETATVFGVPHNSIPSVDPSKSRGENKGVHYHIHALPERASLEIRFPRVDGYHQATSRNLKLNLEHASGIDLDPSNIPPAVLLKAGLASNEGRPSLHGPGKISEVDLKEFRTQQRVQERIFDLATHLVDMYDPDHTRTPNFPRPQLFQCLLCIVSEYYEKCVRVQSPNDKIDVFLAPYYGYMIDQLLEAIQPDTDTPPPELPVYVRFHEVGSTADVDFYSSRKPLYVSRSHVNAVVPDSTLEEEAATLMDNHPRVRSFVKNQGLGFAIRYRHKSQIHNYIPDFIIDFADEPNRHLIVEMKGYTDPLVKEKKAAAIRWINAVSSDGQYGQWEYELVRSPEELKMLLD